MTNSKLPLVLPLALVLSCGLAPYALSQTVNVEPTTQPPRIDGKLDDPVWRDIVPIRNFQQREPNPGAPPSEETEVYVTFDHDQIYFGFRCKVSSPDEITAKEMARDADLSVDDRVQIILDTFLDRRNGYWFQIGPRSSIGDALVSDNGERFNKEWDGLWEGRAAIGPDAWTAEVAIPFKTLNFRPGQSEWGLKLIRYIKRKEEVDYWPLGNLDTYRFQISDSGTISGLKGLSQGKGLDIRPYGLAGINQYADRDSELVGDAGVDVFYQLTPGLKTALTINTDFAETEVDQRRVNLTRFPLFFPEKRDFFLDGADYFTFGTSRSDLIPFFSRRLGLDENGEPIPITVGGKLTGRQGQWNMGVLGVIDDQNGDNRGFGVVRVTRNLGRQSSVGMIATGGNALGSLDNSVIGGDFRLASSTFRGNQNIGLTFFGLKSSTSGTRGNDSAYGFQFLYPNDFVQAQAGFQEIGDDFNAGIGFVPRVGIRQSYASAGLGPRPRAWGIRQFFFRASGEYITDLDNSLLTRSLRFTPVEVLFDSGDHFEGDVTFQYEWLTEDFAIHPDYTIPTGSHEFAYYSAEFRSAHRRDLWFDAEVEWGEFFNGRTRDLQLATGYKVAVPLFLGVQYERNRVYLPEGDFTANVSRLNANILFSPDVTLYNYVQYDNLSERLGWQSRFYWILKPGNEIIMVWNSSITDPFDRFVLTESTARFKVNYNFRF